MMSNKTQARALSQLHVGKSRVDVLDVPQS